MSGQQTTKLGANRSCFCDTCTSKTNLERSKTSRSCRDDVETVESAHLKVLTPPDSLHQKYPRINQYFSLQKLFWHSRQRSVSLSDPSPLCGLGMVASTSKRLCFWSTFLLQLHSKFFPQQHHNGTSPSPRSKNKNWLSFSAIFCERTRSATHPSPL